MSNPFDFEPSASIRGASKSFHISLPFRLSRSGQESEKSKMTLSQVKLQLELSFQELEGPDAESLRYKIRGSREVKDLWMLRTDVHQLISRRTNQQEAAQRINALLPCFEHWIPAKVMTKV